MYSRTTKKNIKRKLSKRHLSKKKQRGGSASAGQGNADKPGEAAGERGEAGQGERAGDRDVAEKGKGNADEQGNAGNEDAGADNELNNNVEGAATPAGQDNEGEDRKLDNDEENPPQKIKHEENVKFIREMLKNIKQQKKVISLSRISNDDLEEFLNDEEKVKLIIENPESLDFTNETSNASEVNSNNTQIENKVQQSVEVATDASVEKSDTNSEDNRSKKEKRKQYKAKKKEQKANVKQQKIQEKKQEKEIVSAETIFPRIRDNIKAIMNHICDGKPFDKKKRAQPEKFEEFEDFKQNKINFLIDFQIFPNLIRDYGTAIDKDFQLRFGGSTISKSYFYSGPNILGAKKSINSIYPPDIIKILTELRDKNNYKEKDINIEQYDETILNSADHKEIIKYYINFIIKILKDPSFDWQNDNKEKAQQAQDAEKISSKEKKEGIKQAQKKQKEEAKKDKNAENEARKKITNTIQIIIKNLNILNMTNDQEKNLKQILKSLISNFESLSKSKHEQTEPLKNGTKLSEIVNTLKINNDTNQNKDVTQLLGLVKTFLETYYKERYKYDNETLVFKEPQILGGGTRKRPYTSRTRKKNNKRKKTKRKRRKH